MIETALRAHFARQIEALCYRTSKYRRGRSLLALCIALNTKRSTRHITSIATSDILVVVIVVTGLNRVPTKIDLSALVVVTGNFLHEHHDPASQGDIINSHERSDQP